MHDCFFSIMLKEKETNFPNDDYLLCLAFYEIKTSHKNNFIKKN